MLEKSQPSRPHSMYRAVYLLAKRKAERERKVMMTFFCVVDIMSMTHRKERKTLEAQAELLELTLGSRARSYVDKGKSLGYSERGTVSLELSGYSHLARKEEGSS